MQGKTDRLPLGKCSQCGGVVSLPKVFYQVIRPVARCEGCGAVVDETASLPIIAMMVDEKKILIDSFCSWCNRRMNIEGQPYGREVPRYEQKGTHGVCTDCLEQGRVQP